MESSPSKAETMKPLFLKAGITLVLSVAGFISAKILARRTLIPAPNSLESEVCSPEATDDHEKVSLDEERFVGLRNRVEELQKKELELENQFLEYHVMKEQESMLMEIKNVLVMEAAHVEFLGREISSMEAEKHRFQVLVVEFLKFLENLEFKKLENGLLRRKVNKLSRKMKEQSRIIREKDLKIDAAEEEILRCCNDFKELEDQVQELQSLVNSLQEERNQLLIKLHVAENSSSSTTKSDEEGVTTEEYNKVVEELEQLRKEEATEIAELICLKWNNACLRHELMRNQEQEKQNHLELKEINGNGEIKDCKLNDNKGCSRKKKLLHKIKKWVDGNEHVKPLKLEEKEKQEKDHINIIQARRSCSSD